MSKKASNNAGKHLKRIIDTHAVVDNPVMTFVFRDSSVINLTTSIYEPKVEVVGPSRSFARLFEKDLVDVKVTFDQITFFFRDGSKFDLNYGNIPRKMNL